MVDISAVVFQTQVSTLKYHADDNHDAPHNHIIFTSGESVLL